MLMGRFEVLVVLGGGVGQAWVALLRGLDCDSACFLTDLMRVWFTELDHGMTAVQGT